jgi:hypothetical protein
MHHRITFQGESAAIRRLADEIQPLDGIVGLAYDSGGSLKPPGDILQVEVLNSFVDEVLRRARPAIDDEGAEVVVIIAQSTAVVDRSRAQLINKDADEIVWEEMEADLRNHGRISWNYAVLMALGGIVATVGFVQETVSQSIAFVGAAIIAPAFEPVAKLAQGIVLRQLKVCGRAVASIAVGYAVACAAAFVTVVLLSRGDGGRFHEVMRGQPVLQDLIHFRAPPLVMSAAAAVAGVVMIVSLRDLYVVGPLMVLVLLPNITLVGAGLALRDGGLALDALRRLGADLLMIVVLGAAVFYWKQRAFHRRRPLT